MDVLSSIVRLPISLVENNRMPLVVNLPCSPEVEFPALVRQVLVLKFRYNLPNLKEFVPSFLVHILELLLERLEPLLTVFHTCYRFVDP